MSIDQKLPFMVSAYFLQVAVHRIVQYILKTPSIGGQFVYSHDQLDSYLCLEEKLGVTFNEEDLKFFTYAGGAYKTV